MGQLHCRRNSHRDGELVSMPLGFSGRIRRTETIGKRRGRWALYIYRIDLRKDCVQGDEPAHTFHSITRYI